MWAVTITAFRKVTVVAESLIASRPLLLLKPLIKMPTRQTTYLSSMLGPITFGVIYSQKLFVFLSTADTYSTVMI
jgi:hypothetical protein